MHSLSLKILKKISISTYISSLKFATRINFANTFINRKGFGGKLKLSHFFKFTHPDKFSDAS